MSLATNMETHARVVGFRASLNKRESTKGPYSGTMLA